MQEKRDSLARSAPRNDKIVNFSAACSACRVYANTAGQSQPDKLQPDVASIIAPPELRGEIEWRFARAGQNSRRAGNPAYATLALL